MEKADLYEKIMVILVDICLLFDRVRYFLAAQTHGERFAAHVGDSLGI